MENFEKLYDEAVASGLLPGYALISGDKDGNVLYSNEGGLASLKDDTKKPFQLDTICAIASMTKLMTAVAALQCIQEGLVDLDEDCSKYLPSIGKYGIMTGFDEDKNEAILTSNPTPITLRMLLTHTSGHEYDFFSPALLQWRASRGETPWQGATVKEKSTVPLLYEPGTSWSYGQSADWAGKLVEKVSGRNLDIYMKEKIWDPLGITDLTFYPKQHPEMQDRMATISTLNEVGEGPAIDMSAFDLLYGATDCLGGGGCYGSAEAYFTFLQAVLRRDASLLSENSWTELFRPQLDERCKKQLNDNLKSTPLHTQYVGMCLPTELEKQWSFAGLICEKGQEGRMDDGTIFWGGVPSMTWYLDFKAGTCGVAFCQVVPPMSPRILALHEEFQRAMFQRVKA